VPYLRILNQVVQAAVKRVEAAAAAAAEPRETA